MSTLFRGFGQNRKTVEKAATSKERGPKKVSSPDNLSLLICQEAVTKYCWDAVARIYHTTVYILYTAI